MQHQYVGILDWNVDLVHLMLSVVGLMICYLIVQSIIRFLMRKHAIYLLNYWVAGLIYLILFLWVVWLFPDTSQEAWLLRYALQAIAVFGGLLFLYRFIVLMWRRWKNE
ncbi:hypothetical protein DX933_05460 [Ornithinibacillus gellani]|uniref:hypothetical protein n=1 Tax=Ornithinibacillus gellani TaxID=2293253 RepID=UPI000F460008|nr:hypothetical protein [Ornithinibacillus gellani]TQS75721.1 hypothetical protein DX933_05460 [Ornithinibacillus gellani]